MSLPEGLRATTDLPEVVRHAEMVLLVVPTPFLERTVARVKDQLREEQVGTCACHASHLKYSVGLVRTAVAAERADPRTRPARWLYCSARRELYSEGLLARVQAVLG